MSMGEKEPLKEEEQPNKTWSFIVGILIALAIIIVFALLFNR
jgi:hypothetical protein